MTPEQYQRVQEILAEVIEAPPEKREQLARDRCGGDAALLSEVLSLLAADAGEEGLLDQTAISAIHFPEALLTGARWAGRRLGPYRILREINAGGMGLVLLGEGVEQFPGRHVAIKMIRWNQKSDELLHRFRREQRILSRLRHPNIAEFLDVGLTPEKAPYLVMEYIDGEPLDRYCDHRRLTVQQRLRLFLQICDAVAFAHSHQIVHRDLKPDNILVNRSGVAKLLDFGVSKVLKPPDEQSFITQVGMRRMTFEYAAPEQFRGDPITPAADIYALGILLCELVTGVRPYQLEGLPLGEAIMTVCKTPAKKPGDVLADLQSDSGENSEKIAQLTRSRGTDLEELSRFCRQHLDAICGKALEKDPAARYPLVEEFAAAVRNCLPG